MKRCFEHYCNDIANVENYETAKKDNFKGWHCHHRLETHNSDGERRLVDISHKELIALGMYYSRPAEELIFLTAVEHRSLHHKGKKLSDEHKRKIGEVHKGQHLSEETKAKLSEAFKGRHFSEEAKLKMAEAKKGLYKGKHWKLVDGKRVWY